MYVSTNQPMPSLDLGQPALKKSIKPDKSLKPKTTNIHFRVFHWISNYYSQLYLKEICPWEARRSNSSVSMLGRQLALLCTEGEWCQIQFHFLVNVFGFLTFHKCPAQKCLWLEPDLQQDKVDPKCLSSHRESHSGQPLAEGVPRTMILIIPSGCSEKKPEKKPNKHHHYHVDLIAPYKCVL